VMLLCDNRYNFSIGAIGQVKFSLHFMKELIVFIK